MIAIKAEEIYEMVRQGKQPIIQFNEDIENLECCIDGNMRGRVISAKKNDVGTERENLELDVNIKDFEEYNKPFMKPVWVGKNGNYVNYLEAGMCESGIEKIFLVPNDEYVFLVEGSALEIYYEYLRQRKLSETYVEYLERRVESLLESLLDCLNR